MSCNRSMIMNNLHDWQFEVPEDLDDDGVCEDVTEPHDEGDEDEEGGDGAGVITGRYYSSCDSLTAYLECDTRRFSVLRQAPASH